MVYVVLSDLYMYHANIDFICFDSASNLGTDTNPDVNINGSQDAELPAYNDPAVISKKICGVHHPVEHCMTISSWLPRELQ